MDAISAQIAEFFSGDKNDIDDLTVSKFVEKVFFVSGDNEP